MRMRAFLLFLCCTTLALPSLSRAETEFYGGVESFRWADRDQGFTLTGPVWLVGAAARIRPPQSILSVELRAEGFSGEIEDDGQAIRTDVQGVKVLGDLGLAANLDQGVVLEPFAGLGVRWWEIDTDIGDENWRSSFGRLGLRAKFSARNAPFQTTVEAGARFPLGTRVHNDDGTFHPEEEVTPFAEISFRSDMLKVAMFYEKLRFSDLNIDNEMFGVRLGVAFR
ncbi:MAG TPA: hypothetical protein VNX25_02615 [Verrucomicrobiae bacterium]|nr:hypothetical protein [Verrucomicrobiae bacterium]